jgi:hypothetical protein
MFFILISDKNVKLPYPTFLFTIFHSGKNIRPREDDGEDYHLMSEFVEDLCSLTATDATIAVLIITFGTLFVIALHWYSR